jgi:hypothetical protein
MAGYPTALRVGNIYQNAEGGSGGGTPKFFANDVIIGAGASGSLGEGFFYHRYIPSFNIASQLNKNIGFMATIRGKTPMHHFGWANVSWDATAKALTFNSAYVESVAGNTITVGDIGAVPEPSRALLALAGLGAAALRRRRKQAA